MRRISTFVSRLVVAVMWQLDVHNNMSNARGRILAAGNKILFSKCVPAGGFAKDVALSSGEFM